MTPSTKPHKKRKSIIKSTKTQRIRAEAIALKQERLSLAVNSINQATLPTKSPHKPQILLPSKSPNLQRNISNDRFSISNQFVTTSRLFPNQKEIKQKVKPNQANPSFTMNSNPNLIPTTHVNANPTPNPKSGTNINSRVSMNTKPQQTKGNIPNFDKLHEEGFKKQKSITCLVKEV